MSAIMKVEKRAQKSRKEKRRCPLRRKRSNLIQVQVQAETDMAVLDCLIIYQACFRFLSRVELLFVTSKVYIFVYIIKKD